MVFLWKNSVVVLGAIGAAWLAVQPWVKDPAERRWLLAAAAAAGACTVFAFTSIPFVATMLICGVVLAALFAQRAPIAAGAILVISLCPSVGLELTNVLGFGQLIRLSIPLLLGMVLLGATVWSGDTQPRPLGVRDMVVVLFLVVYSVLEARGYSGWTAVRYTVERLLLFGVPYFVTSRHRIERPDFILKAILFAGIAMGIVLCFETAKSWLLFNEIKGIRPGEFAPEDTGYLMRGDRLRATGPYDHPLTASIFMSVALVVAAACWLGGKRNIVVAGAAAIALAGLVATLSRSGVLSAGAGLLVLLILQRRYLAALLALGAGAAAMPLLFLGNTEDAASNSQYRLELLLGIPPLLRGNLLLGNNRAVSSGLFDDFVQGQGIVDFVNSYLALLAMGGLVSLGLFLVVLFGAYRSWRGLVRAHPAPDLLLLGQASTAAIAAIAVGLAVTPPFYSTFTYLFLLAGLLVAARRQAELASRQRVRAAHQSGAVPAVAGRPEPAIAPIIAP